MMNDIRKASGSRKKSPAKDHLTANDILIAEFNYIAQSAFQANEDRARVTNFFLVTVGSFLAAMLSFQFEGPLDRMIYLGFSILFFVLTIASVFTLQELSRLRLAWHESALAMNQIKEYYQGHFSGISLQDAFRWSSETLPPKYKPGSISHLQASQVSFLGGAAFIGAIVFGGLSLNLPLNLGLWIPAILAGVVVFFLLIRIYKRKLKI